MKQFVATGKKRLFVQSVEYDDSDCVEREDSDSTRMEDIAEFNFAVLREVNGYTVPAIIDTKADIYYELWLLQRCGLVAI